MSPINKLLEDNNLIFLDTAIFIYHFEANHHYSSATQKIFRNIEAGRNLGMTTTLTLAEIVTKPLESGKIEAVEDYKYLLNNFPNLSIIDINQKIAIIGAGLRAKYKLKLPDALQLAGGITHNASLFITNDKKIKKVKEIKVVTLDELL
jgi:predicted nucleic acid-binding protein